VNPWSPENVHSLFKQSGIWNNNGALAKRILEFCSASGRMADAELSGKATEFMASVGKTMVMYYDISASLGFSPDISNISKANCTYSVDLINSAIAWAYAASTMQDRKSSNFGRLGSEWLSHVWNCIFVKLPSDSAHEEIQNTVLKLIDKQMTAQCIATGIPASRFFAQQKIEGDIVQKVEVPF
jgi:hypothetical protein